MLKHKKDYFKKLNELRDNSNIGQLLYAAEQCLDHASLISWEINYDKKRKHIIAAISSIHEYLKDTNASIEHCPTRYMHADQGTKSLHGDNFNYHKNMSYGRRDWIKRDEPEKNDKVVC